MSREGGIYHCIDLVKEVQNCLGDERKSMNEAIDESHLSIAEQFRYDNQAALNNASVIFKAEWRIRAFKLISKCCEHIINADVNDLFRPRSDNEESSQNVYDAISNLVHLARVLPDFYELRKLGKCLKELFGERPESVEFKNLLSERSASDSKKQEKVQEIADQQRWNLASVMVYVKKIFDKYRIMFQTLLFISEVISYVLNLTAKNNIRILVPILVLSATCFLFINIPLIRRCPCCRKRTVRVISQMEWVESSFSIFQLAADILKVAGHAKSSSKVTETWVLVFAVIGYVLFLIKRNTNVDGGSSNRKGIRNWVKFSSFGSLWSRMIGKIKRGNSVNDSGILEVEDKFEV